MAITTYSTGGKVLTFVKIRWPLPHHVDLYCINKNAFKGTACAYMRPFANINLRTPKWLIPLNWQNFFARWSSSLVQAGVPPNSFLSDKKDLWWTSGQRTVQRDLKLALTNFENMKWYIYIKSSWWNTYKLNEGANIQTAKWSNVNELLLLQWSSFSSRTP